jgi:hypothetical protein
MREADGSPTSKWRELKKREIQTRQTDAQAGKQRESFLTNWKSSAVDRNDSI